MLKKTEISKNILSSNLKNLESDLVWGKFIFL